jgi:hypothetical protein
VPIDDVDKLPWISAQLKLNLTLFVDDQLGGRAEDSATLAQNQPSKWWRSASYAKRTTYIIDQKWVNWEKL